MLNLYRGSGLGLAHDLNQVGAFRPKNKDEKFKNLYYVGASTTPGTGLPMVVISSKLVTERITNELHVNYNMANEYEKGMIIQVSFRDNYFLSVYCMNWRSRFIFVLAFLTHTSRKILSFTSSRTGRPRSNKSTSSKVTPAMVASSCCVNNKACRSLLASNPIHGFWAIDKAALMILYFR